MKTEKRLLGVVGVDSGQLMIGDPCYVEENWVKEKNAKATGVQFWGSGQETMRKILSDLGKDVSIRSRVSEVKVNTEEEAKLVELLINSICENKAMEGKVVVTNIARESTYHKICEKTLSKEQGGELEFPNTGIGGFMVAFTSGMGDGCYNVYGHFIHSKDFGTRIAKVEVELIEEGELDD